MNRNIFIALFSFVLCFASSDAGATLSQAEAINTLKGLKSISIVVEEIGAEAEKFGLTTSEIQTECELRLRKVGISVPPKGTPLADDQPYLYVYVNMFLVNGESQYIYNANLEFRQKVSLSRIKSAPVLATTWDTGTTGLVLSRNGSKVRIAVGDLMDEFANAYLTANPRETIRSGQ